MKRPMCPQRINVSLLFQLFYSFLFAECPIHPSVPTLFGYFVRNVSIRSVDSARWFSENPVTKVGSAARTVASSASASPTGWNCFSNLKYKFKLYPPLQLNGNTDI